MIRAGGIAAAIVVAAAMALAATESTGPVHHAETMATTVNVLPLAIVTSFFTEALTR
jgi:hypothetical protein